MAQKNAWDDHKTADAKELQQKTKPPVASIGMQPDTLVPRPDLNGLRVKLPADPAVYLIDDGLKRHIPDPTTYTNLFRDWNGIIIDININEIPSGSDISIGAVLARGDGTAPVYLIDQGVKRWITSPAAMDKYYFSWDRVVVVPITLLTSIPDGASRINA
jgi:hypothetical protein